MIPVKIMAQPDDVSCGPTCLHAVYGYYGDHVSLEQVIQEVACLEHGGTLAVLLGIHALKRGYQAEIYTYNLKMFDPSWLIDPNTNLLHKLTEQLKYKQAKKFKNAAQAYIEFLKLGGKIYFEDLTPVLLSRYFKERIPILAGLSATYLYQSMREHHVSDTKMVFDDLKGMPQGHFVILCGYDSNLEHVVVADPFKENPISKDNYYAVNVQRLINSIMLGAITYDANVLIIDPRQKETHA